MTEIDGGDSHEGVTEAEVQGLAAWLENLRYNGDGYSPIRQVESTQPVNFWDGRLLRGVKVSDRLYIARDRRLYTTREDSNIARAVTYKEALELASLEDIQRAYIEASDAAEERRRARRGS